MQEDLQKLPPGFPRGALPQPPFIPLAPTMGQMHTLMPTQSLQPTQQLEYKVQSAGLDQISLGSHQLTLFIFPLNLTSCACWSSRSNHCCSRLPSNCSTAWGLWVEELPMAGPTFSYTLSSWKGPEGPRHLSPARWGSGFLNVVHLVCRPPMCWTGVDQ